MPFPSARKHPPRHHRGTAAIELMLVIPVLLTMIFLVGANLKLGGARIRNVFNAETDAYRDATVTASPSLADNPILAPTDGFDSLPYQSDLPTRVHISATQSTATLALQGAGRPTSPITLTDQSAFIAPAWGYSGYPVTADTQTMAAWFDTYASEARSQYQDPLGLAPSSPP
jgi:hypothetical protein